VPKKNIVWHTNGIEECSKKLTKIIYGEVKEVQLEPYINAPMMELE